MGFFKELGHGVWETVEHPFRVGKRLGKGDLSGAWNEAKGQFGENQRNLQDEAQKLGIGGWVGKHPQESIGALIASIFGGIYAAGAYGAGAAAGSGAAAGGSAGAGAGGLSAGTGYGAGSLGSGLGMTYTAPTALTAGSGGAGASAMSYAPLSSSVLSGTGATGIGQGASLSAMGYNPTQSTLLGGQGSGLAPDYSAGLNIQNAPSTFDTSNFKQLSTEDERKAQPAEVNYYRSNFNYTPPKSTEYSRALENLDKLMKRKY
ncbi:hypothetical protein [Citrobacter farmeri]|uniref:hypothetical protein n=1 Tax=Citrobacter farmeri TaxID=67824 RepID=UPI0019024579|nr:hypothetical protein [Citrobacter farmeri]MBJ9134436.1 hypothetical protein [Citrobacter farmeri]